jgi:signal transduction histidine kinase
MMKLPKLKRLHRFFSSVFTKLIAISLATWLLILITVVVTFFTSRHGTEGPFYKNASRYIQYIVEDIGSPPDRQKALQLSEKTGMHLSYIGENQRWTTRNTFPAAEKVRFRNLHGNNSIQVGRKLGHHYLRLQTDKGLLFFEFAGADEEDRHSRSTHLILFFLLSAALFASYLAIKRVLLPLKWLGTGVHQVKEGNLSHLVPLRGNDELTDLASSFNEMTAQLKSTLAAKEHLLRDISHELRTPLTRLRVALELLENTETSKDMAIDIAEMEEMIRGILETAREHHNSHRQDLKKYNLTKLIQSVTAKYKQNIPAVIFSPPIESLYSLVDEKSLQTVLTNCIENGLKFSSSDSRPIEVGLSRKRGNAVITITDNGCGIEENELAYIFEPFYRVDASRSRKTGGYGLGLSICKAIIEAHGGTIKVYSKKGEGTQILYTLPLST